MIQTPSHTQQVFDVAEMRVIVDKIEAYLRENLNVRALAACGFSGVPIVSAASFYIGIPITLVRKPEEVSHKMHCGFDVTGYVGAGDYAIVDDMVSSGSTVKHIMDQIRQASGGMLRCVDVLTYASYYTSSWWPNGWGGDPQSTKKIYERTWEK